MRKFLFISRYVELSSALESFQRVYNLSINLPQTLGVKNLSENIKKTKPLLNNVLSLWKKRCFAISLATQFLNCIEHLQLTIFICYECYRTSCKNYKSCNSLYIWCNSLQLNYSFVVKIPFQLLCNSPMITIIMSCWHHFSSIHQNLTCGTMRIFYDFFEILVSIFHYDYLF